LSDLCIYKSIVLCSLQFLTSALVIYSVLSFLAACAYDILTLEAARWDYKSHAFRDRRTINKRMDEHRCCL